MKDYVIDKLSWHLQANSDRDYQNQARARFSAIASFLQHHGLTKRELLPSGAVVTDDFALRTDDLTNEGRQLMDEVYDRWLKSLNRGKSPDDLSMLEKQLSKLRTGELSVPLLEIYDKAKYHYEGEFPDDLLDAQAFVHTGFFLGWLAENDLLAADIAQEFSSQIAAFKEKRLSGPRLYEVMGGVFDESMLTDEGNLFTKAYFDLETGQYVGDYQQLLASDRPSFYHVEDDWANYATISACITRRYLAWRLDA